MGLFSSRSTPSASPSTHTTTVDLKNLSVPVRVEFINHFAKQSTSPLQWMTSATNGQLFWNWFNTQCIQEVQDCVSMTSQILSYQRSQLLKKRMDRISAAKVPVGVSSSSSSSSLMPVSSSSSSSSTSVSSSSSLRSISSSSSSISSSSISSSSSPSFWVYSSSPIIHLDFNHSNSPSTTTITASPSNLCFTLPRTFAELMIVRLTSPWFVNIQCAFGKTEDDRYMLDDFFWPSFQMKFQQHRHFDECLYTVRISIGKPKRYKRRPVYFDNSDGESEEEINHHDEKKDESDHELNEDHKNHSDGDRHDEKKNDLDLHPPENMEILYKDEDEEDEDKGEADEDKWDSDHKTHHPRSSNVPNECRQQ